MVYGLEPKPSVKQLEKVCGIHFPAFVIVEKEESTGSHANFIYTVHFKKTLGQDVVDQIEYQCKYGEMLDSETNDQMPWTKNGKDYSFHIDSMFDSGPSTFPWNCRSISINIDKESEVMTIHYMMDD